MSDDNIDTGAPENGSTGGSALKALVSFFTIWHMDIDQGDMDAMERNFGLVPIVGLLFGAVIIVAMTILDYINISPVYSGTTYKYVCAPLWISSYRYRKIGRNCADGACK